MSETNGEVRSKILGFEDPFTKLHAHPVAEWGVIVYLKGLTGRERDRIEQHFGDLQKATTDNLRARILVRVLLDESGQRIFQDDDAERLGEQQAPILDDLFGKAMYYAGLTKGQREETLKNLSAGPAGSQDSGSPASTEKQTATAG